MTATTHDFQYGVLDVVAHRPWPMPVSPWVMTQTWHDVLFAHWPINPQTVRAHVPPALNLDLFDDDAWVGVVAFEMSNVAPRGVPALPWLSAFPEINVRTYVRVGDRPGVYFFSLDAASRVAVRAARALFQLPYFRADMDVHRGGDGTVEYTVPGNHGRPMRGLTRRTERADLASRPRGTLSSIF